MPNAFHGAFEGQVIGTCSVILSARLPAKSNPLFHPKERPGKDGVRPTLVGGDWGRSGIRPYRCLAGADLHVAARFPEEFEPQRS